MPVNGHIPVIPHHIDMIFIYLAWRKVPVRWIADIAFINSFVIKKEFPFSKLYPISLQRNHAFEQHHFFPGQTDDHHIFSFRFGEGILEPETEIKLSVHVRGLHTVPLYTEGDADKIEKEHRQNDDKENPEKVPSCDGRKKEFFEVGVQ